MLEIDIALEQQVRQVADWYDVPAERYAEIVLRREVDRIVADNPNLAYLTELS